MIGKLFAQPERSETPAPRAFHQPTILAARRTYAASALRSSPSSMARKLRGAIALTATVYLITALASAAHADDVDASLFTQKSLTDTPDGPKEQLRRIGIMPDVWITQFYQGQTEGSGPTAWLYGGKLDAILKVDAEKLGLWRGLHVNVQYEHYFGRNINRRDFALLPVNTAQAYVERDGYHSALSISVTQDFGENVSLSVGKFNMMTLASRTPLLGGGGIDTFMNRALALPSTGVAFTNARGSAGDRVVISAPYLIGGLATIKTDLATLTFGVLDPRSAQDPRVIERPFERGVAGGASLTVPVEIAGLRGYHTVRGAYSNARGVDLADIGDARPTSVLCGVACTKKGYWFTSYAIQQNFFQSESNPAIGWGLFTLVTMSDGNPNPVKWSYLAGLAGNNLLPARENDRWGIGIFHYGLSQLLLSGLAELKVERRSEGGVEAFYNFAITPWLRLSADLQIVDPWNPAKLRATYAALRLQTKF